MNNLGLGIIVSMKDAFSRNAHRIQSSMQSLDASVAASSERMTRNLDRIQKGTMLIGAGLAALAVPAVLIASTSASQKALGELASLGVQDLRAIEDAAESFTNQWSGTSKAEFIAATYDVKSALSGLSDEAVGVFTSMAALTAKATKATTQEMVGTFTSGYGIFKPLMADMTDMEWATAFSGAMAQTVASFKTNGQQMAEAIKNIGAVAASAKVPLEEQLAILGQLQTTMPGSEAGTLYKNFMMKAAEAGEELGLSFTDSTGRLRSVTAILREIQSLYPDLSQAAAQVKLKKAFGSDEALKFVLQMSAGMETLEGNIQSIQRAMQSGTAVTEEMARAMNLDIGSQVLLLRQQLSNLFEILGRTMLPVVGPLLGGLSRMILFVQDAARNMPGLSRAALGLTAALGLPLVVAGSVMAGIGLIGMAAPAVSAGLTSISAAAAGIGATLAAWFWPVTLAIAGVVGAIVLLRYAWKSNFAGIRESITQTWQRARLIFDAMRALTSSLSGGMGQMSADLANQLKSAGLMSFVVALFRLYYRSREYLSGLSQAFAHAFGRVRAILEPAVRSLMEAGGTLYRAFLPLLKVLGLVNDSTDASGWHKYGQAIGTFYGVLAQLAAWLIRFAIEPLSLVVRSLARSVRIISWGIALLATSFMRSSRFVFRFILPVRVLAQSLLALGRIAYAVWQVISGDISLIQGFKKIAAAIMQLMATPFRWMHDIARSTWNFVRGLFESGANVIGALGRVLLRTLLHLPLVAELRHIFDGVRSFLSGDLNFFEAGKRLIRTFGEGILSAASWPYQGLKSVLGRLRKLLPFSDAQEGPLSTLTASGSALIETFTRGMRSVAGLPLRLVRSMGRHIHGGLSKWDGMPALANAQSPLPMMRSLLMLTPVLAAGLPLIEPALPGGMDAKAKAPARLHAQSGSSQSERDFRPIPVNRAASSPSPVPENLRAVLEPLIARLAESRSGTQPITIQLMLDGRQISEAVIRDQEDRHILNYGMLS